MVPSHKQYMWNKEAADLTIFIALNIVVGMWSENMVGDTRIWSKLAFSAQIAW